MTLNNGASTQLERDRGRTRTPLIQSDRSSQSLTCIRSSSSLISMNSWPAIMLCPLLYRPLATWYGVVVNSSLVVTCYIVLIYLERSPWWQLTKATNRGGRLPQNETTHLMLSQRSVYQTCYLTTNNNTATMTCRPVNKRGASYSKRVLKARPIVTKYRACAV